MPTITPGAGAGTDPYLAANGDDIAGWIGIRLQPDNTGGPLGTFVFDGVYDTPPKAVILGQGSKDTGGVFVPTTQVTATGFNLVSPGPLGTPPTFVYHFPYFVAR